jgi:hypothetical protein
MSFDAREFRLSSLALAAFVVVAIGGRASAQDYEELPLYQDPNGKPVQSWSGLSGPPTRDKTDAIVKMLSGESPMAQADFDQYFNEIVFPLFTQWKIVKYNGRDTSPMVEGLGGVNTATMRSRFKSNFAKNATNSAVHEHLNELTLEKMKQIATGNFHPILRANAVMMIAELNDTDPNGPAWKKALPVLVSLATAKDAIDPVRVSAWRGLVRQAQAGADSSGRTQLISAALQALADRNNVSGGQDARDWISRRAIDVLAVLNDSDANSTIAKALLETLNDVSTSLTIRTAAAEALAKMKFHPPADFNATALAKTLGKIAIEDYKSELAQNAKQKPMIVDRLKQQLMQVKLGLVGTDGNGGVHAMSPAADTQQYINSLLPSIEGLIAACNVPLLDPPAPSTGVGNTVVVIPIDRQKNIAEALSTAGTTLEAAVTRGEGAAPAEGAPPGKTPPAAVNPLGATISTPSRG